MLADKVLQQVVAKLYLTLCFTDFAAGVIHQHAEITHTELIHSLHLAHKALQLVFTAVFIPLDGVGGVNRPHKAHMLRAGFAHQLADFHSLIRRVGLVAAQTMVVGVILRGVNVGVHLVTPVELELRQTRLKAPRCAVVALHRATEGQVRPVHHGAERQHAELGHLLQAQLRIRVALGIAGIGHTPEQLREGLLGVVHAGFGVCPHLHLAGADADGVSSIIVGGQLCPFLTLRILAANSYGHLLHAGETGFYFHLLRLGEHAGLLLRCGKNRGRAYKQTCNQCVLVHHNNWLIRGSIWEKSVKR